MLDSLRLATARVFEDVYTASAGHAHKMADWATFHRLDPGYDPSTGQTSPQLTQIGKRTIVVYAGGNKVDQADTNMETEALTLQVQEQDVSFHDLRTGYIVDIEGRQYEITALGAPNPVAYEVEVKPWSA